jgi:hypothetical protein
VKRPSTRTSLITAELVAALALLGALAIAALS